MVLLSGLFAIFVLSLLHQISWGLRFAAPYSQRSASGLGLGLQRPSLNYLRRCVFEANCQKSSAEYQLQVQVDREQAASDRLLPNDPEDSEEDKEYMLRFNNVAQLYGGNGASQRLRDANVCVIGLGGVGSWVVESLSRSGIGHMTLVDFDDICISNTNRQLPAMTSTVGQFKADCLKERVLDINPHCKVTVLLDFARPDNVDQILLHPRKSKSGVDEVDAVEGEEGHSCGRRRFDYVVDATDSVSDKAAIVDACVRSGTPVVVSGGVGGLTDPTLLRVSDLSAVVGDNLLMRTRKRLRQKLGYPAGQQMSQQKGGKGKKKKTREWGVPCVHTLPTGQGRSSDTSTGSTDAGSTGGLRSCDSFGNACFSTGTAGFVMSSVVVNNLAMATPPTPIIREHQAQEIQEKEGEQEDFETSSFGLSDEELVAFRPSAFLPDSFLSGSGRGVADTVGSGDKEKGGQGQEQGEAGKDKDKSKDKEDPSSVFFASFAAARAAQEGKEVQSGGLNDISLSGLGLVDAHCHLNLDPLFSNAALHVSTAENLNVSMAGVCATSPADWDRVEQLYHQHPAFVSPAFGLHPHWILRYLSNEGEGNALRAMERCGECVDNDNGPDRVRGEDGGDSVGNEGGSGLEQLEHLEQLDPLEVLESRLLEVLERVPKAAVGECGLDKRISRARSLNTSSATAGSAISVDSADSMGTSAATGTGVTMELQERVLRRQLDVAARLGRPVILHCVGCWGRLAEVLGSEQAYNTLPAVILHSANGMSVEMLPAFQALCGGRVYYSFCANNIRKHDSNNNIRQSGAIGVEVIPASEVYKEKFISLARAVSRDRILIETDSPDQMPRELALSMGTNTNEPAVVQYACLEMARVLEMSPLEVAELTSTNAMMVFSFASM